jgi:hypothetical protein
MERIWLKSYPTASPPTSTPASNRRSSRCWRPASASTPTGQRVYETLLAFLRDTV